MNEEALTDAQVEKYLPCAAMIARKYAGRGVEYDDLYQVASLALLKAMQRFDGSRGSGFISYLIPTVTGEVLNYIRENTSLVHIPTDKTGRIAQMHRCEEELFQQLHRSPTVDELAQTMHTGAEQVLELMELDNLRTAMSSDDAEAEQAYPERGFDRVMDRETVKSLLTLLSETEKRIVCAHYLDGKSQRQIADETGISQMTVSRIEKRALKKLARIRE